MLTRLNRGFYRSLIHLKTQDFYKILGVTKSTSETEIKQAYFSLAKKFHPDINKSKDAKEKFSEINLAYETLGDKAKKKIYDNTGLNSDEQNQERFYEDFEYSEEVFQKFSKKKGDDITVSIEVSFLDAVNGCTKSVAYDKLCTCSICKGTRAKSGTTPNKCSYCYGHGVIILQRGPISIQAICDKCKGLGYIIKQFCPPCKGKGYSITKSSEDVKIPPGVDNGYTIKLPSKGSTSNTKGPPGDLFVKLRVKEHPVFKRTGFDIHTKLKIHIAQAALGGVAEIETLHGKIDIKIDAGLNNCENLRLSNYGVQHLPPNHSQRGHHFISFSIHIPKKITNKQRQVLEELAKIENNNY
jgi:molecular chaperone DnaJ